MTMDTPVATHSRRIDDLIEIVQIITQEVNDFLMGGSRGANPKERMLIKRDLQQKQATDMDALQKAMTGQKELLDQLASGEPTPQRRATDPKRTRPNMKAVEDITEIKRLAGITEEAFEPARVFRMIEMMAKEPMTFSSPYHIAQRIIDLAQKIER